MTVVGVEWCARYGHSRQLSELLAVRAVTVRVGCFGFLDVGDDIVPKVRPTRPEL